MKDLGQFVKTPTGRRWLREAGAWADEKIRPCTLRDDIDFVIQQTRLEDCYIDPRMIVGTSHASYNQGTTWREFLAYGKRIKTKLDVLETKPEYYDDPKGYATDTEPWHLFEINGELFTDTGNHRSTVAKFRAHEEGRVSQLVWSVDKFLVSGSAKQQYEELQEAYLPGEGDQGPRREKVFDDGVTKKFEIFVDCYLHGIGTNIHRLPISSAPAFVRKRNRFRRAVLNFASFRWRQLFKSS